MRIVRWIWHQGIVSTFLAGLFAILPLVITVVIVTWVAGYLHAWFGPHSSLGFGLSSLGAFVVSEAWAWTAGLLIVLVAVWGIGLLMKSVARTFVTGVLEGIVRRIPIIKGVYDGVAQVVAMLTKRGSTEVSSMSVVFCSFGQDGGAGLLCLQASAEVFSFSERQYYLLYLPTSPLPMTGGLVFVPIEHVQHIAMSAEELMRVYLSLGILAPQVVPSAHQIAAAVKNAPVLG
jgi:uncharacterized membrane protein